VLAISIFSSMELCQNNSVIRYAVNHQFSKGNEMACRYCGVENCDSAIACACDNGTGPGSGPASMSKKALPPTSYASLCNIIGIDAKFRAKCGLPLEAGVLPTPPVPTASAATPVIGARPKPRRIPPDMPVVGSYPRVGIQQAAEKQQPERLPELPKAPVNKKTAVTLPPDQSVSDQHDRHAAVHSRWSSRAAAAHSPKPEKRSPLTRRKHAMRIVTPLQVGLVGSIFTASMAVVLGTAWWIDAPRNTQAVAVTASPSPTPAVSPVNGTEKGTEKTPDNVIPTIRVNETPVVAGVSPTITVVRATPGEASAPLAVAQARQEIAVAAGRAPRPKSATPKKIASAATTRRAGKRTAVASRKERTEEIDRLKTQAFSETRKDRLDRGKAAGKPSARAAQFDPQSAKPTSSKTKQLASTAGLRNQFMQCEHNGNFFSRERCKWRVCGGKWGRDGCPSYRRDEQTG
jgi:hypothetical protein